MGVELDTAIGHSVHQSLKVLPPLRRWRFHQAFDLCQQFATPWKIHRPPVVRVHQVELPQLTTLIDIGYTRRSELDQRLGQAVEQTVAGDGLHHEQEV